MDERSFSIVTIGCKLNQYESECIRQDLEHRQWLYRRFEEGADCFIINSCTVTGKSDSRCRNIVRRARRIAPQATIIVTGCYAETQPGRLECMDEVDLVIGNQLKKSIPVILERIAAARVHGKPEAAAIHPEIVPVNQETVIEQFHDHSRPFIKIQEGCNASCSYCIIPRARGESRSVHPETVLRQVRRLHANGYQEIVLTGTHIGRYGVDLGDVNLETLVSMILDDTADLRIRLSSIEVTEVTGGLLSLMRQTNRFAPHLHIPLQSGDDSILRAMNRPYSSELFKERILEAAEARDGVSIGTDIIVGFPGETEERFTRTYDLVRDLPVTYLHVFSFSSRPNTIASKMPHQCSPEAKKRRSRKLIRLGKAKKRTFLRSRIGTREIALVQGPTHRFSRFSRSLTGNYCEVYLRCPPEQNGRLLPITISHYLHGRLYGQPTGESMSSTQQRQESGR
ncbi:MAG: tRNA (N(6)-L-threonylcarbamoyladenosine(37)-C(2))-methylthiotransferase MtaB [bacterium]|nr:MAG: tRNA (N(6)-L-threonylcarbamoyladenosine(37)-C(2))-methylthiotransferase MtaB [bacterium]